MKNFFPEFFLDALYRPVADKLFVLEDFVFGMGTSVASVLTAETIFEDSTILMVLSSFKLS